ncbi:MAG: rod shape-determining protein RodA [Alphaproteobacteria bacterium]
MANFSLSRRSPMGILWEKQKRIPRLLMLLIFLAIAVGGTGLYSAAGGAFYPWAGRHLIRFCLFLPILLFLAVIPLKTIFQWSYVAHFGVIILLVIVEIMGHIGMGAQRWLALGSFVLQPSELCKITLILALARYCHHQDYKNMGRIPVLIPPILMMLTPIALVLLQPNLGTATILGLVGLFILFLAGLRLWKIALGAGAVGFIAPIVWEHLHDYQKRRVTTFMHPEDDPLGAGYHISQSKIALGAGGINGRGFLQGSQSHLNFLPEKQTDFIFTLMGEEWGLKGTIFILALYGLMVLAGYIIAFRCRHQFGRLVALGLSMNLFLYLFINTGMVMGLMPVVGIPLPLLSYGGTSMLAVMIGFGLLCNMRVHGEEKL